MTGWSRRVETREGKSRRRKDVYLHWTQTFNVSLGFRSKLSLINYGNYHWMTLLQFWLAILFTYMGDDNGTSGEDNELGKERARPMQIVFVVILLPLQFQ